jgi:hypothetical protein
MKTSGITQVIGEGECVTMEGPTRVVVEDAGSRAGMPTSSFSFFFCLPDIQPILSEAELEPPIIPPLYRLRYSHSFNEVGC